METQEHKILTAIMTLLLDQKGFEAWWLSIDQDVRKQLIEDLQEVIKGEL